MPANAAAVPVVALAVLMSVAVQRQPAADGTLRQEMYRGFTFEKGGCELGPIRHVFAHLKPQ